MKQILWRLCLPLLPFILGACDSLAPGLNSLAATPPLQPPGPAMRQGAQGEREGSFLRIGDPGNGVTHWQQTAPGEEATAAPDAVVPVTAPCVPGLTWHAEYWRNTTLSGRPQLSMNVSRIDFYWGVGSPAPALLGYDHFSAHFSRCLDLPAGEYQFVLRVNDGGRLFVGDQRLIDSWQQTAETSQTAQTFVHAGGLLPVRLEYYEEEGGAEVGLDWASQERPTPLVLATPTSALPTSTPPPLAPATSTPMLPTSTPRIVFMPRPSPTATVPPVVAAPTGANAVIVDDGDAAFVQHGGAGDWRTAVGGYGGLLHWGLTSDRAGPGYALGRWSPDLQPDQPYEVLVYIPATGAIPFFARSRAARYDIAHAGGYAERRIDQSAWTNQWISLGTYVFRGAGADYVALGDLTGEPEGSTILVWDAVQFVPVDRR